jgi:hypothetical protein
MPFSLDTPSTTALKAEARALREERDRTGAPITHSAALEEVARRHGYRDWNTAHAALPDRLAVPVQVGQRVQGTYLSRPFIGLVVGVKMKADGGPYDVTVQFDAPVNVSKSALFEMNRRQVTATVDHRGISFSRTSDGEPHLRVRKI